MLNCITKKTMFKSHREHQQHPNMNPMDDKQQCQPSNQPTFFNFSRIAKQLMREIFLKMQVLARSLWVSCPGVRVNADISSHELWNPLELSSPLCWSYMCNLNGQTYHEPNQSRGAHTRCQISMFATRWFQTLFFLLLNFLLLQQRWFLPNQTCTCLDAAVLLILWFWLNP